jgi:hypothetical protein
MMRPLNQIILVKISHIGQKSTGTRQSSRGRSRGSENSGLWLKKSKKAKELEEL